MSERINVWFSGDDARRILWLLTVNPLNPKSDQYLISLHSNTAEPFIKNTRVKEMIAKLKKTLIVQQILLLSTKENVLRRVWRMWILIMGCKRLIKD